jgi:hypothetical protein
VPVAISRARWILLALATAAATLALLDVSLRAQEEAPETFVPTEKLPVDAAVSFPVDI